MPPNVGQNVVLLKETYDPSFGPIGPPVRATDPFLCEKRKCDRAKGN